MSDIHDELQHAVMAARLLSRRIRATGTVHRLFKTHLDTLEAQLAKLDAMRMQQAKCQACNGRGEIGGHVGQTPEQFDYVTEPCPDCAKAEQPAKGEGAE